MAYAPRDPRRKTVDEPRRLRRFAITGCALVLLLGGAASAPAAPTAAQAAATPSAGVASAPSAEDLAFQRFVADFLKKNDGYVSAWYATNLDSDPAPERVARVCFLNNGKEDAERGAYLIEDAPGQRLRINFEVDGRTPFCNDGPFDKGKPKAPKWEVRSDNAIVHEQPFNRGAESIAIALRRGNLVITAWSLDEDGSGKDIDWDKRCAKVPPGKKHRYSNAKTSAGKPLPRPPGETCYPSIEAAEMAVLTLAPL